MAPPPSPSILPSQDERSGVLPTVRPGGSRRQGKVLVVLASVAVGVTLAVIVIIAFLQLGRDDRPAATQSGQGIRQSTQTTVAELRGVTPSNWQPFIDPQYGWHIAIPPGWEPVQDRAGRVSFSDPSTGAFVRVERAEGPLRPLVREAERAERTLRTQPDYKRVHLQNTVYKGVDAVEWEFTYSENGERMHAADLHLLVHDVDYVISYQAPESTWATARPVLERIRNSFEAD